MVIGLASSGAHSNGYSLIRKLVSISGATPATMLAGRPLFSLNRLSLSAGLDYAWYGQPAATSSRMPEYAKEWEAGLYGAYTLAAPSPGQDGPIVSIVGSSAPIERLFEQIVVDAEHHVAIHLDEAAIAVIGESAV